MDNTVVSALINKQPAEQSNASAIEKIEVSIQRKRECFNQAKRIVEQLIDRGVTEQFLLQNAHYITQEDYQDAVEERAITQLCGYPMCNNDLGPMPNKRYHISSASNRVFDITERKNFCSNWCYKASLYFKEQVLSSPVWFREFEAKTDISFLPRNGDGLTGDEISLQMENLDLSGGSGGAAGERSTVSSFAFSSLEQYHNDGIFSYDSLQVNDSYSTEEGPPEASGGGRAEPVRRRHNVTCSRANGGIVDLSMYEVPREAAAVVKIERPPEAVFSGPRPVVVEEHLENQEEEKVDMKYLQLSRPPSVAERKAKSKKTEPVKFDAAKVSTTAREWFTLYSLFYIHGTKDTYRMLVGSPAITGLDPDRKALVEAKLQELCKKIDELGRESSQRTIEEKASPELLKVQAFYKGKTSYEPSSSTGSSPLLPNVDRYEQKQARQKLVITRLDKVFGFPKSVLEIADILRLKGDDLGLKLNKLTDTFEFSAHNIMMKPQEWNLIGLIMIKLLTEMDSALKKSLRSKKTTKILKVMLDSMGLDLNFLDKVYENLYDVDHLMSKIKMA